MRKTYSTIALLALSACLAAPPESPTAGPGNTPVDPAAAAQIFAETCLATHPGYAGLPAAIAARPFTRNSTFGTYYHNALNLSVKAHQGGCSMVFVTNDPAPESRFLAGARAANVPVQASGTFSSDPAPPPWTGKTIASVSIR